MATLVDPPRAAVAAPARRDAGAMLLLVGMVAVSRLTVVAAMPGEQDSALFTVGLWRWIHAGPQASLVYDRQFSPGYYWLGAHLAALFHTSFLHYISLLNGVSLIAAVLTAPLAYRLARGWLTPVPAFWATLLWLLSPAVWWTGIEPHPQALAMMLTLAALVVHRDWALRRNRAWAWGAFFLVLVAALLIRGDTVFIYGAFFWPWVARREHRPSRRAAALTLAVLVAAPLAFFALRGAIVGMMADPSGISDLARVADYWGQLSLAAQILPFLTAAGLATTAFAALGLFVLPARRRLRWLIAIGLWSAPGTAFWLLVRGNTVRHVALLLLPLLFAGADGWQRLRPSRWFPQWTRGAHPVAVIAALALILGAALPVGANVTLYPSGDVPLTAVVLRRKEHQLYKLGAQLAARPDGVCYLGSYTSPYVMLGALRSLATPTITTPVRRMAPITWIWSRPAQPPLVFHDVYSTAQYLQTARMCPHPISAEYDAAGHKLHPMGLAWLYGSK
jgi:hypothetical protein